MYNRNSKGVGADVILVGCLVIWAAASAIFALLTVIVYATWNHVVVDVANTSTISWGQAILVSAAFTVASNLLFRRGR